MCTLEGRLEDRILSLSVYHIIFLVMQPQLSTWYIFSKVPLLVSAHCSIKLKCISLQESADILAFATKHGISSSDLTRGSCI
jgi:hypothetical protein